MVMALRLTPSEPRDAPRPQKTSDRACNTPLQRRARGVCLFEPWPSIKPPHLRKPFARPAPRIWAWDKDGFLIGAPRPPDPIPLAPGAHVLARFNGLVAILDKPDSAARRLASWLARREPYRRATPLKLGAPPVPQRCELREVVLNTHHFAVCAMDRRAKDQRSRLLSSAPPDSS
ncbi:MAG: hypothetical protein CME89_03340 [Hirschia sp.]|nr:hypothetical protein [Hirschia sp.]